MELLLFACLPSLLMSGLPILLLWHFFANIKASFFGIPTQAEDLDVAHQAPGLPDS